MRELTLEAVIGIARIGGGLNTVGSIEVASMLPTGTFGVVKAANSYNPGI